MPSQEALVALAGGSIHEHRKATRKMRWWYESLADFMIANPRATQNQIAAHFGRAPGTISTIINTDSFKAYMRQRREAHAAQLDGAVREKLLKVTDKGLDLILEQFDKKRDTLPIDTLQRSVDSTLKALGYGAAAPQAAVNVKIDNAQTKVVAVPVAIEDLEAARAALRNSQRAALSATPPTIEGVVADEE